MLQNAVSAGLLSDRKRYIICDKNEDFVTAYLRQTSCGMCLRDLAELPHTFVVCVKTISHNHVEQTRMVLNRSHQMRIILSRESDYNRA